MKTDSCFSGKITFQGDVHGKLWGISNPNNTVIQVGDLGVGFVPSIELKKSFTNRHDFYFIRGNHDNPDKCKENPRYLGDFGFCHPIFWLSGAQSVDQASRLEGRDWWRNEELSTRQANQALDLYIKHKPKIMVSHDGPCELFETNGAMVIRNYQWSLTSNVLQAMFRYHKPQLWVFGHHHISKAFNFKGTHFRCLAELETFDIEV